MDPFVLLVVVVVLAIAFDYINGFHDTANAIATVVSTGVMSPRSAVLVAAAFNFIGAFIGTGVAKTIGGDIADPASVTQTVVAAALVGAIVWNLVTWYYGIPSSSSHALVGGIVGAVFAHRWMAGAAAGDTLVGLLHSKGVGKVLKGLVLSPLAGLLIGLLLMILLLWLFRRTGPSKVNLFFRRAQLLSASAMALSHGSNDAQKAMGIVTMALVAYYGKYGHAPSWLHLGGKEVEVPMWVIAACATAMALGTAAGGWRIIKTMGSRIIRLKPIHGFAAETAGAIVIQTASHLGAPVSTTHVISSAIMGVGASKRVSAVRWGVAGNMLVAWILTLPVSALVGALSYWALRALVGA